MTTIRAAVEALRTSREALPAWASHSSWHQGEVEDGAIVDRHGWVLWRPPGGAPVAAHIALTSSPHVVQALEELLGAIDQYANQYDGAAWIERAAERFAAALTRETK